MCFGLTCTLGGKSFSFFGKLPAAQQQKEERAGNRVSLLLLPPQSCPRNFPMCRSVNRLAVLTERLKRWAFCFLPLSACVILNTWLLSPVPFPPNAHLVTVSSCLHALTLNVPESSVSASPGQLRGCVASQNMVNISSLCHTFPPFWGKRQVREAILQVLRLGELNFFLSLYFHRYSPQR